MYDPVSFKKKQKQKQQNIRQRKKKKSIFHKSNNKGKSLGSKIRKATQSLCYANTNI